MVRSHHVHRQRTFPTVQSPRELQVSRLMTRGHDLSGDKEVMTTVFSARREGWQHMVFPPCCQCITQAHSLESTRRGCVTQSVLGTCSLPIRGSKSNDRWSCERETTVQHLASCRCARQTWVFPIEESHGGHARIDLVVQFQREHRC